MKQAPTTGPDIVLHALNAGEESVVEISTAQAMLLRQGGEGMLAALNSIMEDNVNSLDEPLKTQFLTVKGNINQMLAKLPTTDQVPAANRANWSLEYLLRAFLDAQAMIGNLGGMMGGMKAKLTTATNSVAELPTKIQAAIDEKVAKGELFAKKDHELSVNSARTEGEENANKRFKLVSDNRVIVSTNNLPMPEDTVLADTKFTDLQTRAGVRKDKLSKFTLPEARITALCWSVEDAAFDQTLSDLEAANPKGSGKAPAAAAFTKRVEPAAPKTAATATRKPLGVL